MRPIRLIVWLLTGLCALSRTGVAETPQVRGAYLVEGIANRGNCHAPREPTGAIPLTPLSGGPAIITPAFAAYPPNITPDRDTGTGSWTEDQIVTALREGRTPDGRILPPPMPVPFYRGMADADAHAIAAYVLSRPAVAAKSPASVYSSPHLRGMDRRSTTSSHPQPPTSVPMAHTSAAWAIACCATPRSGAGGQRDYAHRLGAGGLITEGAFGRVVTANITPDKATGIGAWTDTDIARALTTGGRPDGRRFGPPMPVAYLARLHPEDLSAVIAWLRSLQPVANKVAP